MHAYSLTHLSDAEVLRSAEEYNRRERNSTAMLIAHIAEIDARRLYLPAGYPSTFEYCVAELGLSEDAALVARFGSSERARPMTSITPVKFLHAPGHVSPTLLDSVADPAPVSTDESQAEEPAQEPPPVCFKLQVVIEKTTHDKLRHLQTLLSHALPSGDVAQVLDRSFDALIGQLERQKFAKTAKPRPSGRSSGNPRHIPAHVKRAVRERDQAQCTFVSKTGHRCGARKFLEFDHIDPVARGGQATVDNVRLRCRAHNQYEAEGVFGSGFMDQKRKQARRAATTVRAQTEAAEARSRTLASEQAKDVLSGLRELGFREQQARRASEYGATLADATLEDRMRAALKFLCPKVRPGVRIEAPAAPA